MIVSVMNIDLFLNFEMYINAENVIDIHQKKS